MNERLPHIVYAGAVAFILGVTFVVWATCVREWRK